MRYGLVGTTIWPISSCSMHSSMPRSCMWLSRMTSSTSRTGASDRDRLHLAERARPRRDQRVGRFAIGDARRVVGEARFVAQILAPHCPQQIVPMLLDGDVHRNVAVIGRVDVQRHAAMAGVAGAWRRLAGLEIRVQLRGQGRVGGLLHRHLDEAAPAGALALEKRGQCGGIKMDPGNEIDDRRAGLDRRPVRKAGRRDQVGCPLPVLDATVNGEDRFIIDGIRSRKSGSHRTHRWREMDSNFRFRAKGATDLSFRFCLCP
jgi:hypothetical protein